jgi:ceramide glucosyltransferase
VSLLLNDLAIALMAASAAGSAYAMIAIFAVWRFAAAARGPIDPPSAPPAVTMLKPLHGAEPLLLENLRSFCTQAYPKMQIVFGVRDHDDTAIEVVEQLKGEVARLRATSAELTLLVDARTHGANGKVSNLINMMTAAKHDVLVMSDSDMVARPDYLDRIVTELGETGGGAVTCLYLARSVDNPWAELGAQYINYEFLPSVLVGRMLGADTGCYGATIALDRDTLAKIGGLERFKDLLADDYAVGAAVRSLGRPVRISKQVITTTVRETDLKSLISQELRFARTIRSIAPWGYAGSAVTHPVPLALLAIAAAGFTPAATEILAVALAARILVSWAVDRSFGIAESVPSPLSWRSLWLAPLRDVLSFCILVASFCGARIVWRDRAFRVDEAGRLTQER